MIEGPAGERMHGLQGRWRMGAVKRIYGKRYHCASCDGPVTIGDVCNGLCPFCGVLADGHLSYVARSFRLDGKTDVPAKVSAAPAPMADKRRRRMGPEWAPVALFSGIAIGVLIGVAL